MGESVNGSIHRDEEVDKDQIIASLKRELRSARSTQGKLGLNYNPIAEDGDAAEVVRGAIPFLNKIPNYSVNKNDNDVEHLLIEGDNLPALVVLNTAYQKKVDVIYIDPPYNTGNKDFVLVTCSSFYGRLFNSIVLFYGLVYKNFVIIIVIINER